MDLNFGHIVHAIKGFMAFLLCIKRYFEALILILQLILLVSMPKPLFKSRQAFYSDAKDLRFNQSIQFITNRYDVLVVINLTRFVRLSVDQIIITIQ